MAGLICVLWCVHAPPTTTKGTEMMHHHWHRRWRHARTLLAAATLAAAACVPAAVAHDTTPLAPAPTSAFIGRTCLGVQDWINTRPGQAPATILWAAAAGAHPAMTAWGVPLPAGAIIYSLCTAQEGGF